MKPSSPEDSNFANELAQFRPVAPRDELKERIRQLAQAEASPESMSVVSSWFGEMSWNWAWGAVAALLLVAMGVAPLVSKRPGAVVSTAPEPEVFEEETLWSAGEVAGIVESGDGQPMWKLRYETVRRIAWSDEKGTTRLRFEPEERLIFVPVSYN